MNTEYQRRRRDRSEASRRERMRFVGSAVGLWAVCATGVYLIGPGEEGLESPASPVHSQSLVRASASVAAYQP